MMRSALSMSGWISNSWCTPAAARTSATTGSVATRYRLGRCPHRRRQRPVRPGPARRRKPGRSARADPARPPTGMWPAPRGRSSGPRARRCGPGSPARVRAAPRAAGVRLEPGNLSPVVPTRRRRHRRPTEPPPQSSRRRSTPPSIPLEIIGGRCPRHSSTAARSPMSARAGVIPALRPRPAPPPLSRPHAGQLGRHVQALAQGADRGQGPGRWPSQGLGPPRVVRIRSRALRSGRTKSAAPHRPTRIM